MKGKVTLGALAAVMVVGMVSMLAIAAQDETGNGAPSGKHETINIIGVPNPKNVNFDGGQGSRIFVLRTGQTKFYVGAGSNFAIEDHDGTDGAVGTGPNPEAATWDPGLIFPYSGGVWQVDIYVRLLGPKGSEADWASYYWDEVSNLWVLWDSFTLTKDGAPKFSLRTGSLLANGEENMLWTLDPVTKYRICQMRIFVNEVEE